MELLVLVLPESQELEELMVEFTKIGISGSTIIDSVGMANILSGCEDTSLFASFQFLMNQGRCSNKTIFTVLHSDQVQEVLDLVSEVIGGLEKPGNGIAFTLPLNQVRGGSFN